MWEQDIMGQNSLRLYILASLPHSIDRRHFQRELTLEQSRFLYRILFSHYPLNNIKGRWSGVEEDRICHCGEDIEDEVHFLVYCRSYTDARGVLAENLGETTISAKTILALFNAKDSQKTKTLINFIFKILKERDKILETNL